MFCMAEAAPSDDLDEDLRILARAATRDEAAAERVHEKLMAAEETAEIAELARAAQRLNRSLRQTLALKARLKREARAAQREEARGAAEDQARASADRKAAIRARVREMIWTEAEAPDCHTLIEDLDDRLSDAERLDGFADAPVAAHVARLRGELGLEPGVEAARRRTPAGRPAFTPIEVRFIDAGEGPELIDMHGQHPDTG